MKIRINLIPTYKKQEILEHRHWRSILGMEAAILAILAVFFATLVGFQYILKFSQTVQSATQVYASKNDQFEKMKKYDDEFTKINKQVNDVVIIKKDQLYWTEFFLRLDQDIVPGIEITNLSTKDYDAFLAGKSDDRDSLINFKGKLEADSCFTDVDLPLSNLVSRDDIAFQIDFKIKGDCLKKK
jgi:hypothetical protein